MARAASDSRRSFSSRASGESPSAGFDAADESRSTSPLDRSRSPSAGIDAADESRSTSARARSRSPSASRSELLERRHPLPDVLEVESRAPGLLAALGEVVAGGGQRLLRRSGGGLSALGSAPGLFDCGPGPVGLAAGTFGLAPGLFGLAPGLLGLAVGPVGLAPRLLELVARHHPLGRRRHGRGREPLELAPAPVALPFHLSQRGLERGDPLAQLLAREHGALRLLARQVQLVLELGETRPPRGSLDARLRLRREAGRLQALELSPGIGLEPLGQAPHLGDARLDARRGPAQQPRPHRRRQHRDGLGQVRGRGAGHTAQDQDPRLSLVRPRHDAVVADPDSRDITTGTGQRGTEETLGKLLDELPQRPVGPEGAGAGAQGGEQPPPALARRILDRGQHR